MRVSPVVSMQKKAPPIEVRKYFYLHTFKITRWLIYYVYDVRNIFIENIKRVFFRLYILNLFLHLFSSLFQLYLRIWDNEQVYIYFFFYLCSLVFLQKFDVLQIFYFCNLIDKRKSSSYDYEYTRRCNRDFNGWRYIQ
jgi:hypothetical protein